MKEDYVDMVWNENPNFIRTFHENKSLYSLLCEEVEFILKREISKANIEVASISSRAKTESSFCEKINRKEYGNPFSEITDFAGARVVFLYLSDKRIIESIIETEFNIKERVDKVSGADVDQFGYGALHYLVTLKSPYLNARYCELKDLICEIQIRTILQDAWAIVAHHLSYKQESDIPKHLRRKLNALSGLFETADDQFESIKSLRVEYQNNIEERIKSEENDILSTEINIDNLIAYLSSELPDRKVNDRYIYSGIVRDLKTYGIKTLRELDGILKKTLDAISVYELKYPPTDSKADAKTIYSQVGVVRTALKFINENYRSKSYLMSNQYEEFKHLLK